MTHRRKIVEALLSDLRQAGQLLDGVAEQSRSLKKSFDRSSFVMGIAETLTQIFELECDLFDLEPNLAHDFLKPSLVAIDLNPDLERLLSEDAAIQGSAIRAFRSHMTDEVAANFAEACETGAGYEFAQTWWRQQKQPFISVVKVYKDLRHCRRYVRYHSAKLLEPLAKVKLWNQKNQDVMLEAADEWFAAWQQEQSDRSTP